jgi:hypothetical protein
VRPIAASRRSRSSAIGIGRPLSRDSWRGQRKGDALGVKQFDCPVGGSVKCIDVSEGLMREMMRLEVTPDEFDVVQFRRILWQPLDGEPVHAGCEGCQGELAGVDRTIVQDERHRLDRLAELGP